MHSATPDQVSVYPKTYHFVRIHDCLKTMGHGNNCDVVLELMSERLLNDSIGFVIYANCDEILDAGDGSENISPMADVASSKISSLLCLTMARARAMICLWPTDKLPPPLAISVSSVILFSSERRCNEKRPAARRASLSVASSYCPKTSKLWRRVPPSSSGYID